MEEKYSKPFFSIITCTKNSERFLKQNIDSVKSQTFRDYEHIFIDGYSKDRTVQIIRDYLSKSKSKVKLFQFPPLGISDAFNRGIEKSCGKYIFFLNSDDRFCDNKVLESVYVFLNKNTSLDWIYGKIRVIEEDGEIVGVFPKWKIFQISWKYLLKFINFIPHQAVFMRKGVFKTYGIFDKSLDTSMDYDYWLRVSRYTKWKFFNQIISDYRIHAGSASSDSNRKRKNFTILQGIRQKHLNFFERCVAEVIDILLMKFNKTYR